MIVIDASLAVKWFVDEAESQAAIATFSEHIGAISVPDLFGIEVAAALVRKANVHKEKAAALLISIDDLASLFVVGTMTVISTGPKQLAAAANLAIELGHRMKDCLYLALAIALGCPLVTADARFAAKAGGMYEGVQVLGEA